MYDDELELRRTLQRLI